MTSQQNPGGRQKTPRNKSRGQGGFPADQRRFAHASLSLRGNRAMRWPDQEGGAASTRPCGSPFPTIFRLSDALA